MSLRVNKIKFIILGTVILFLMSTNFSYIIPIPGLNDVGNWRFLCLIVSLFGFFYYVIFTKKLIKKYFNRNLVYLYSILFFLGMTTLFIYSTSKYNQSIFDVLISSEGQFYVFLVFVFVYIFSKTGVDKFFNKLTNVTWFLLIVYFIAFVIYSLAGINIFNVGIRYNHLRLDPPFFAGVVFIYNLYRAFTHKDKKSFLFVIVYMIYLFTLTGTRMEMIASLIGAVSTYVYSKKGSSKKFFLFIGIAFLLSAAYSLGMFDFIINSFDVSSENGLSTSIRLLAIEYFMDFYNNSPFTGMGYVRGGVNSGWDRILYGVNGKYVFSDVGLLGFYLKTGVCSLLLIGIPIIRVFYLFFKAAADKKNIYSCFLVGLFTYFLVCQTTLAVTDVQRCLLLPLIWGVFEFCVNRKGSL